MEIYKLDRIEDNIATIEDPEGNMISVSAENLPEDAKSGDCFTLEGECFIPAQAETEKRRSEIKSLLGGLLSKN